MPDPTIFAVGASVESEGGSLDLPLPAGDLTGKVLVAFITSDDTVGLQSSEMPTFVLFGGGGGGGGGLCSLSILWARAADAPANPQSFVGTDFTAAFGFIAAVSDLLASGDVVGVAGFDVAADFATATVNADSITPPSNENAVFFVANALRAVAAPTCSGYSGTDPTFTEFFDAGASSTALGGFMSLHVAMGVQDVAAATGARTATLSAVPTENHGVMFSLKPAAASLQAAGYGGARQMLPLER